MVICPIAFTRVKTGVFWDMEDCGIPNGLDFDSVYENVKSALADVNHHGPVSIRAYGETSQFQDGFQSDGITLVPAEENNARSQILDQIIEWVSENPGSNIMLIGNRISRDYAILGALVDERSCYLQSKSITMASAT